MTLCMSSNKKFGQYLSSGVIVDRGTFLVESQDSPREAQRRDARLPRSHTVLQIMPHCCKRSSSMRPEGRSGNGSGDKRIPADTAKRNVVDAKHGVVAKDDERITTTKPGRSR